MTMSTRVAVLLVAIAGTGCAGILNGTFSPSGRTFPPRSEDCAFEHYSVPPETGFEQIGTIDIVPGYAGTNWPRSLGDLKQKVAPTVCRAGGDAIFSTPNGVGAYFTATVFKRLEGSMSTPIAEVPAPAGCQFDAHCKGDRVCVNHECVEPAKKQ